MRNRWLKGIETIIQRQQRVPPECDDHCLFRFRENRCVLHSRMNDIGGPVDIIILLGIAAVGAVGMAVLVYNVQSLFWGSQQQ